MPKLRVHNFAISLDGYAAGPNQDVDNPLGVGGPRLHEWGPIVNRKANQVRISASVRWQQASGCPYLFHSECLTGA